MTSEKAKKNRRMALLVAGSALAGASLAVGVPDVATLSHMAVAAWTSAFPLADPVSTAKLLFTGALSWLEVGTHLLQDWAGGWMDTLSEQARASVATVKEAFSARLDAAQGYVREGWGVASEAAAHWRQVVREAMPRTGEDMARSACTLVVRVAETWAVLKGVSEAWDFALRRGKRMLGRSAPASELEASSQNISISIAINGAPARQAAATEILASTRSAVLDALPSVDPASVDRAAQAIDKALTEALGPQAPPRPAGLDRPILFTPTGTAFPDALRPPQRGMTLVDGGWLIESPSRDDRERKLACDLSRLALSGSRPATSSAVLWLAPDGRLAVKPDKVPEDHAPHLPASPPGDHASSPTLN